jgi:hypothetical protein
MLLEKGCSDLFNNLSILLADMFISSKILAQFGIGLVMMNSSTLGVKYEYLFFSYRAPKIESS